MSTAAPEPKRNMGQPVPPVPRAEARLKVTGEARYPADFPIANLAHGVLVTSSIARGRIRQLHLDEARAVPGVIDILNYENASGLSTATSRNTSSR